MPDRSLLWVALAALAGIVAWMLLGPVDSVTMDDVTYRGQDPWLIGSINGTFAYDGIAAQTISGDAEIRFDPLTQHGQINVSLSLPADNMLWADSADGENPVTIAFQFGPDGGVLVDAAVHGDSDVGENRLPGIQATLAGAHRIEIEQARHVIGSAQAFWSVGPSLRQPDGSIRKQGLVFSPLLRDRDGFSDPERLELTILLYENDAPDSVMLHVVFELTLSQTL